jgi:hypothetical protein
MGEQQEQPDAIARFAAVIKSRRAMLGGSLAALGLAITSGDERESAAGQLTNRQQRRKRRNRRGRRRNGGQVGVGDPPCDVCPSGCQFTSIQTAIAHAVGNGASGVVVCPGTYKEQINYTFATTPAFVVRGAGPGHTIIDAEGHGSAITVALGAGVTFARLTITGGEAVLGGGVRNAGSLILDSCVVNGNGTGANDGGGGGGGGILNDSGTLVLQGTEVSENAAVLGQGGGILNAGSLTLKSGSQIFRNTAHQGGGIFNMASAGGTVSIEAGSTVTNNDPDNCVGTSACGA